MKNKKQTILEWYQKQHRYIDAPCNGRGVCGKCRVRFLQNAPEACEREKELLTAEELKKGIRLACMTEWTGQEVVVCSEKKDKKKVSESRIRMKEEKAYGAALDLGTTTLAISLIGLKSGEEVMTITGTNHQRTYGADVISRIQAANMGKLEELQICIRRDMVQLLCDLAEYAKIRLSEIKKLVIAGNTTMCHLLMGDSCKGLGCAPFEPENLSLRRLTIGELLSGSGKEAEVSELFLTEAVILPGISAFIGADITAGLYACDMDKSEEVQMLLDVGTNGEMVVGNRNGFLAASAAAGPVFEGGNITCGMPAVTGAAAHVKSQEGICEVIGAGEPEGFCGSGLIDAVAFLLDRRLIDENGTFCEAYFQTGYSFAAEKAGDGKCVLTQADIREIQMGKAAIRAGMDVLIKKRKPEKIFLAGGFGVSLDVHSAAAIGMFSKESADKICPAGNTVLKGLKKFLLEETAEERVLNIVCRTREMILANEPFFEEAYIEDMQFEC